MTDSATRPSLYINDNTRYAYRYAREYGTRGDEEIARASSTLETRLVSRDGDAHAIHVAAVPDGVALDANVAVTEGPTRARRLYVYSDAALDAEELEALDRGLIAASANLYRPYPIWRPSRPVAVLADLPRNNFYVPVDSGTEGEGDGGGATLSAASRLVEYRYFLERHRPATVAYEPRSGRVYRLAAPHPTAMVLVMPANFVRTGERRGYFAERGGVESGEPGLIVRCYARRTLASELALNARGAIELVSSLPSTANEERLLGHARSLLARLGMHRVIVNRDADGDVAQIYAYDEYATLVIGRVDNLRLP